MVMFEFKSNGYYGITGSNASFYYGRNDVEMQKRKENFGTAQNSKHERYETSNRFEYHRKTLYHVTK